MSRRSLLAGIPALAVALAGCGNSSSETTTAPASASVTAASAARADGPAAAGSVAALAQAFYRTLDADLQAKVLLDYTFASAKRWSNLPQGLLTGAGMPGGGQAGQPSGGAGRPAGAPSGAPAGAQAGGPSGGSGQSRVGISLGDLKDEQLTALTAVLKAATGTASGLGYDEIEQQLNADDYLGAHGGGDTYGRDQFYVAILGSPQDSGTWEFQFGGHHLAVANTYTDGKLAGATPSFRGVEPFAAFEENGKTNQPLKVKQAAFAAMLAGLSTAQLADAKLADTYSDLVLGPGKDWAFPTDKVGVKASTLSAAQKKLVLAAIATYVQDVADSDAKTILAKYEKELDDTYVSWSGTKTLLEQNDYVRIDGPSVWIEFSMQHGIVLSGNHPHSVWRDRTTDYGGTKS
ncbi:DUF3500 domain-containing protein [Actinoplanes oblitus]|uniref:DUF3500 domain-containing protein n=1 Tax=Actinoplanes oblitus TaxID=3040509 RepID=A0ABY8WVP8_9ACTN|nr:DUF3500 domain-containing protein [Actinoplanes oblitus]WIN00141.1 DUF3500 domain-containing protein [Actinoplanes oblitus]